MDAEKQKPRSNELSRAQLVRMVCELSGDDPPLVVSPEDEIEPSKDGPPRPPKRHRLPDDRRSISHDFTISRGVTKRDGTRGIVRHEGHLIVGLYPNGDPGEIFMGLDKIGGSLGAAFDAWCAMVSIGLQCGVPLSVPVEKFRSVRFKPDGWTDNEEIPKCGSPLDYVAQWLGRRFGVDGAPGV